MRDLVALEGGRGAVEAGEDVLFEEGEADRLPEDEEYGGSDDEELQVWPMRPQRLLEAVVEQADIVVGQVGANGSHPIDCSFQVTWSVVVQRRRGLKHHQQEAGNDFRDQILENYSFASIGKILRLPLVRNLVGLLEVGTGKAVWNLRTLILHDLVYPPLVEAILRDQFNTF
jgi:hypothetical protein